MAVRSSKQAASNFQRLFNLHRIPTKATPPIPNPRSLAQTSSPNILQYSQNALVSRTPKPYSLLFSRNFTTAKSKIASGLDKPLVKNQINKVKSVISQYKEAVGLQAESFWKRNYLVLVGAGGVVICIVLWRIMFGVANTFVGLSEGMAKYGFLALAAAMVSFTGMYIRSRLIINPDKVYRIAMTKLNTHAGILEIMGAPLTGTDVRAYVMSGGGPKLKKFKLRLGSKRCFLIFPIRGSERKGLVSAEVKKKKGQYDFRLLAVDIPMAQGPDQRIFLIGDEEEYKVGGGLIAELRDPIVKAMAAEKEFEVLDEKEEEEDEKREREEAERKHKEGEEAATQGEREGIQSLQAWRNRIFGGSWSK